MTLYMQPSRAFGLCVSSVSLLIGCGAPSDLDMSDAAVTFPSPTLPEATEDATTSSADGRRWHTETVRLVLDGSIDALAAGATDAVITAFGTWLRVEGVPELEFDSVPAEPIRWAPDGENRVYHGPISIEGHENDVAITVAYSDGVTGAVVEADVILNSRLSFAVLKGAKDTALAGCKKEYDVQSVVAHEAGHFLGLGEDKKRSQATMYFRSGFCEVHKRTLTGPDVASMTARYGDATAASR